MPANSQYLLSSRALLCTTAILLAGVSFPRSARADDDVGERRGGQIDVAMGITGCLRGPQGCKTGSTAITGPLAGFAVDLGYRIHKHFFLGAGYGLGFVGPQTPAKRAMQNTVVAVIRGYLPAGRLDFGFELSPGWSRMAIFTDQNHGTYSQGFALRPAVTGAYWLGDHLFLGATWMTTLNFHQQVCAKNGSTTNCNTKSSALPASGHQYLAGIHIGGTF